MGFTHGKNARLWVDQYELTAYFSEFTMGAKAGVAETTVFGRGAKTYIGGLKEGQISGKGFFDASSSANDPEMTAALGRATNMAVTFSPTGLVAAGTRAIIAYAAETDYSVTTPVAGVVANTFTAQADSGLSTGVILYDPTTALTVTSTTTNGGGINDRSVASPLTTSNGLVANLHVLTLTGTGTPSVTVKLQHSDDNATYVDLATFNSGSTITAVGAYSALVAYGTTINRFLRSVITTAGTTVSTTALISAARQ